MALSDDLRKRIRESGLSANALAKLCDVPQPTISEFLAGKDIRLQHTADKLAKHFGLKLCDDGPPAGAKPNPPSPSTKGLSKAEVKRRSAPRGLSRDQRRGSAGGGRGG